MYYDEVTRAAAYIRARTPRAPGVGIVLGSGLGDFANSIEAEETIPYGDIPGFPRKNEKAGLF